MENKIEKIKTWISITKEMLAETKFVHTMTPNIKYVLEALIRSFEKYI